LGAEFQFLNFLSLGVQARPNILHFESKKNNGEPLLNLTLPVTLRYILKPGEVWMIEPYAGVAVNFPLSDKISLSIITPLAGVQIGSRMGGLGGIFFTLEFDYDYEDVIYKFGNNESHTGPRMQLFFGVGVKFGFFNRKAGK
jgi:hypothetical protein